MRPQNVTMASQEKDKAEALQQMDLHRIMRAYIQTIANSKPGYKALLLDKETMRTCSTLFGRTELAEFNVVHIEKLDSNDVKKEHQELRAMVFIRPTRDNITLLKRELKAPRYQHYSVFFTNILSQVHLQELAEADAIKERILEVQEFYGDFVVVDSHHFVVPCAKNEVFISPKTSASSSQSQSEYELKDRLVQGLSSVFLAVRRRPFIRYQRGSEHAQRLADSLYTLMYKQQPQVFDFGARSNPIVLILDRRDDPVTPLLTQWTYQAMLHELIGLSDNTLTLTSSKVPEQARESVLDRFDDFWRKNLYVNYGEVGSFVKALVEKFQATQEKHRQVESLEDMRRFIMEHRDFEKLQGNVTKHVTIMSELSEVVNNRNLMEVSMAEQDLANPTSNLSSAASMEELMRLLRQPLIADKDKVRLVMLYALRFESDNMRVRQLMDYLVTSGVRERDPKLYSCIDAVIKTAGTARRAGDLYGSRSIMGKARTIFKGLQGVDNVYTQHTPLLTATLTNLSTDKLDPSFYPFMASSQEEMMSIQTTFKRTPPREVIVFVVGGSTYEEAKAVYEWNERNPHMRVILGGTGVLNSEQYLAALSAGLSGDGASTAISIL